MKVIYKYEFNVGIPVDRIEREFYMPANAKIVHFDNQSGNLCMWALVDTTLDRINRRFVLYYTGSPLRSDCEYIATAQLGRYVYHLTERR